jgi:NADPH-dependent glutamate synthase beta subunit-like oxidoreductase
VSPGTPRLGPARDGAITLRRSKAPRAGRLITPRRKAYQMRGSNRRWMKLQWRVKEAFMPVAIIGAGAVGATLGQAWLKHGQDVIWGLRQEERRRA